MLASGRLEGHDRSLYVRHHTQCNCSDFYHVRRERAVGLLRTTKNAVSFDCLCPVRLNFSLFEKLVLDGAGRSSRQRVVGDAGSDVDTFQDQHLSEVDMEYRPYIAYSFTAFSCKDIGDPLEAALHNKMSRLQSRASAISTRMPSEVSDSRGEKTRTTHT